MNGVFQTTLNQMTVLFLIMLIGYILSKFKISSESTSAVLSQILNFAIMPAKVFQTFAENLTIENVVSKSTILLYGLGVFAICLIIALILARIFSKDAFEKNIYIYSFAVANFAYMGYAVIGGVFGDAILLDMMIFVLPLNIFTYSVGIAILNPNGKGFTPKSLLNPIFAALILGSIVGLTGIKLPAFFEDTVSSLGGCMGPLAMVLTGFVIAGFDILKLLTNVKVYISSVLRLFVIPVAVLLVLKALNAPESVLIGALGAVAMPLGLNTVVIPAAYGGDTSLGASMALISNILGIISIPVMFAVFA